MDFLTKITNPQWAALSQAIAYWTVSAFYEFIEIFGLFRQYRVQPSEEECKKNLVPRGVVFRHMLFYHATTVAFLLVAFELLPPPTASLHGVGSLSWCYSSLIKLFPMLVGTSFINPLSWIVRITYLASRQFLALVILDAWVFWGHYVLHKSPWIYRMCHSSRNISSNPCVPFCC